MSPGSGVRASTRPRFEQAKLGTQILDPREIGDADGLVEFSDQVMHPGVTHSKIWTLTHRGPSLPPAGRDTRTDESTPTRPSNRSMQGAPNYSPQV